MKECMECGKKLGIIEGYNHPTMGKDYLLCSNCFDTVSISVGKWSEFISPYIGFFNKESSTIDDTQKIGENIMKRLQKIQTRAGNIRFHIANQNTNEELSIIH
ncbi:MAG: hypothetical protein A3K77_02060 [Euryarchaeota archaeon RBG_13_31_8]|nr:MAG: hypothetical protein A3K77_02060 [Euryarchaeota archaeon RBG_13_31_8]